MALTRPCSRSPQRGPRALRAWRAPNVRRCRRTEASIARPALVCRSDVAFGRLMGWVGVTHVRRHHEHVFPDWPLQVSLHHGRGDWQGFGSRRKFT